MKGMGGHHKYPSGVTTEWLTPPDILKVLGRFDLDPCSPVKRPWPTAARHLTIKDDGLALPWKGRVWLNPPYDKTLGLWMKKMGRHHNGIALIFARTETSVFHDHVWNRADALFFLRGRLRFFRTDGSQSRESSGGPSVLISYGQNNVEALRSSGLRGKLVVLN